MACRLATACAKRHRRRMTECEYGTQIADSRSRTVRRKFHARRPYQPFQYAAHPMAGKGVTGPADHQLLAGLARRSRLRRVRDEEGNLVEGTGVSESGRDCLETYMSTQYRRTYSNGDTTTDQSPLPTLLTSAARSRRSRLCTAAAIASRPTIDIPLSFGSGAGEQYRDPQRCVTCAPSGHARDMHSLLGISGLVGSDQQLGRADR